MLRPADAGALADAVVALAADPAFSPESGPVTEFRLELPYEFDVRDYEQILTDARGLLPALPSAA